MKFSLKAVIKKDHQRKDGTSAIYLQCFLQGQKIMIPADVFTHLDDWDHIKEKVRKSDKNADHINTMIQIKTARILDAVTHYTALNEIPDKEDFKEYILQKNNRNSFLKYMRRNITQAKDIGTATRNQHKVVINHLETFFRELSFNQLTEDSLHKYTAFMKNQKEGTKLQESTIMNHLKIIKKYVLKAQREGISFKNPFDKIQVKSIRGNRICLNKEELRKLMHYYSSSDCIGVTRQTLRAFLFSAC